MATKLSLSAKYWLISKHLLPEQAGMPTYQLGTLPTLHRPIAIIPQELEQVTTPGTLPE